MPEIPAEAVQVAAEALADYETAPCGDVRLNSQRAAAKAVAAAAPILAEHERRKVAEEIAAAFDEKAAAAMSEARNMVKAGAPSVADRTSRRSAAFSNAAEIARQIGEARDPR